MDHQILAGTAGRAQRRCGSAIGHQRTQLSTAAEN
jgi:hypothetical protein